MNGTKEMAQRIVNAEESFIALVIQFAACTRPEAEKVLRLYLKKRIAKLDPVMGRVSVRHGIYLEADVLRNAINA